MNVHRSIGGIYKTPIISNDSSYFPPKNGNINQSVVDYLKQKIMIDMKIPALLNGILTLYFWSSQQLENLIEVLICQVEVLHP